MTISIPDDLQKRMRSVKGANWSGIAAAAFETTLANAQAHLKQKKIDKLLKNMTVKSPKGEELEHVREMRSEFLERLYSQVNWREEKATQYPNDVRNKHSAQCLQALHEQLDKLSPSDPLWVRYWNVFANWDLSNLGMELAEEESGTFRSYGFASTGSTEVTEEEAISFLRAHIEALERLVVEDSVE